MPPGDYNEAPFDWSKFVVNPDDGSQGAAAGDKPFDWTKYVVGTIQSLGNGQGRQPALPQLAPQFSNLGYGAAQNTGPIVGYVGGQYGVYPSLAAYSAANSAAMWAGSGSGIGGIGSGTYGNVGGANQGSGVGGGGAVTGYNSLGGDQASSGGAGEGLGGEWIDTGAGKAIHYGVRAPGPTGHQGHTVGKIT